MSAYGSNARGLFYAVSTQFSSHYRRQTFRVAPERSGEKSKKLLVINSFHHFLEIFTNNNSRFPAKATFRLFDHKQQLKSSLALPIRRINQQNSTIDLAR
jgi:hypothetical protein